MPESAAHIMADAKKLADAGQFGKAIEVLQEALKKFPKLVSARVLLGEVYMTSGDFESAKVELEQVIKAMPDNFAAHRKLVLIYRDIGDKQAAAKACDAILNANPKDREMAELREQLRAESKTETPQTGTEEIDSETLAELYIAQGHRDKGLEVYRRLAAKHPDDMRFHERIIALEESEAESLVQATPKARIRRLEGWLAAIRERRRL
ncbi:MAG TPA: tetratricopeptide repeat protein [Nitrospirales bacterium]|jgi:tetratricopeptide (TPR) repeat protein|nr:tetratricopeptide repeat protein [Nitrospirales bacterium]